MPVFDKIINAGQVGHVFQVIEVKLIQYKNQ